MTLESIISHWHERQVVAMLESLAEWVEEHNVSRTFPSDPEFHAMTLEDLNGCDVSDLFTYLRGDNE